MSVMDEVGAAKQQSQTDKQANDAERAVHGAESCGVNLNITAGHCANCIAPLVHNQPAKSSEMLVELCGLGCFPRPQKFLHEKTNGRRDT